MEEFVTENYDAWNAMAKNVAYAAWAIGILVVLYHVIRLATMNDAKLKYDYINRSEIKTLWVAAIILIVGCCFYANSNIQKLSTLWIFVLGFTTFAMGMIVALIIPLTGNDAGVGTSITNAANLALLDSGNRSIRLPTYDSSGGAAAAAARAIAEGTELILGPLLAEDVRAIAPVARRALGSAQPVRARRDGRGANRRQRPHRGDGGGGDEGRSAPAGHRIMGE